MAQKYKMTGCAKFFIFFLIAAPLSYIGASYYNGIDPFAKLKGIEIFKKDNSTTNKDVKVIKTSDSDNTSLAKELELKNDEIKYLNKKIQRLEDLIKSQKTEISKLNK